MSTIRDTVHSVLGGRYEREARPAIERLEAREASIVDAAKRVMAERGIGERDAQTILVSIGLVEPEPVQAPVQAPSPSGERFVSEGDPIAALARQIENLGRDVQHLTEFARRNGYRG